jgi:hypothetical protein
MKVLGQLLCLIKRIQAQSPKSCAADDLARHAIYRSLLLLLLLLMVRL